MLLIEQQIHLCLNHGNSYLVKSSASKQEELSSFSRRQNHCCKLAEGSLLQTFETLLAKYGKKKSNNLIGVLHNKVADPQGGWGGVYPVIPTWFNQLIFFSIYKSVLHFGTINSFSIFKTVVLEGTLQWTARFSSQSSDARPAFTVASLSNCFQKLKSIWRHLHL